MRGVRRTLTVVATVTLCALLSACSTETSDTIPVPVPVPTATAASPAPNEPSEAPKEKDPTLLPQGTALANHAYFDFVNKRLLAVNANPSSTAIVENLVNSGFPKEDVEVTPDKTQPLNKPAASIQFAVRTSKDCLIGQFKDGNYYSTVGPAINGESCLVGETKTIP